MVIIATEKLYTRFQKCNDLLKPLGSPQTVVFD